MDLQTQLLKINGLDLFVSSLGEGPAVLLLHGFPDSHQVWRHQITALAGAGFRAIAPDLRGYGLSSAPADTSAYHLDHLCADALGILDAMGIARAHLVGHDWGAAIAWQIAIRAPERVHSLVALSVGHPRAFSRAGVPQALRSSYMALFLMRGVAELVVPAFDWFFMRQATGQWRTAGAVARKFKPARPADRGPELLPRQCPARRAAPGQGESARAWLVEYG